MPAHDQPFRRTLRYWTNIALSLAIPAGALLGEASNTDVVTNATLVSLGLLAGAFALFEREGVQDAGQLVCGSWLVVSSLWLHYSNVELRYVHFMSGSWPCENAGVLRRRRMRFSHLNVLPPRARLTLRGPPVGGGRDPRKLGGSYTSRPRSSFAFMVPRAVSVGDKMTATEWDSSDFCSVYVFTQSGSVPALLAIYNSVQDLKDKRDVARRPRMPAGTDASGGHS
jgi:hypothetical protein